jgi:hypothetical protein
MIKAIGRGWTPNGKGRLLFPSRRLQKNFRPDVEVPGQFLDVPGGEVAFAVQN